MSTCPEKGVSRADSVNTRSSTVACTAVSMLPLPRGPTDVLPVYLRCPAGTRCLKLLPIRSEAYIYGNPTRAWRLLGACWGCRLVVTMQHHHKPSRAELPAGDFRFITSMLCPNHCTQKMHVALSIPGIIGLSVILPTLKQPRSEDAPPTNICNIHHGGVSKYASTSDRIPVKRMRSVVVSCKRLPKCMFC